MNLSLTRLMADATRLTRGGDLRGATAAIRAALAGAAPGPAGDDRHVIDVEARIVDNDTPGIRVPPANEPQAPIGTPPVPGRIVSGRHTGPAGARDYRLYVPPAHGGQPLPLVVMLHGCTQDPDDFAAGTGMDQAALEQGFLVLYPAQTQGANSSRCWNWFKHNHQGRGRGEPALLSAMTLEVVERYGVDPQRVYVAGLSAGGAMAAILGEAYPDVFAAVGVHSGLPCGAATDVASAFAAMGNGAAARPTARGATPPTIVFHGDQDTTVHPVNGEHVLAAASSGTGSTPPEFERARSGNGRNYTRRVFRDPAGRAVAEHWTVHGSGHAWSGGRVGGSYTDPSGPDATAAMLRFFFSHRGSAG
jgi:poly(hydroxyalkanoate) depolymerase family esterase